MTGVPGATRVRVRVRVRVRRGKEREVIGGFNSVVGMQTGREKRKQEGKTKSTAICHVQHAHILLCMYYVCACNKFFV